ncbi:unnamed protein product [Lampetra planeri]
MQPEPGSGECDTAAIAVAIKFKNGAPVAAAAAVTKGVLLEVKTGGGAALPLFPAGSQAISQPPRARDHKRSCALVSGPGQAGRVAVVVAAMVATAQSGDPERLPWRPGRDVVPVDAPCSLLMSTWREVQDGLEANTYDGREE